MTWVKLDDRFTEHGKVLEAGPLAGWLWVSSIAWSNREGTDGRIPRAIVSRLASFEGIGVYTGNYSGQDADVHDLAAVLVNVGLWEEVEGGFYIHDYSDYQLTTDELAKRREQKSAAGRAGGEASAQARASAPAQAKGSAGAQAESNPGPRIPTSVSHSSSTNGLERALPADLWTKTAEEKLKLQADGKVNDPSAWLRKTARTAHVELADKAQEWFDRYDVSCSQLAQALAVGVIPPSWNHYERRPA